MPLVQLIFSFQYPAEGSTELATYITRSTAKCKVPVIPGTGSYLGRYSAHIDTEHGVRLRSDVDLLVYDSTCQECDDGGCMFKVKIWSDIILQIL